LYSIYCNTTLEGVPEVFATGSNEVGYADTSGVSCWRDLVRVWA
jgi:hypothetical protein